MVYGDKPETKLPAGLHGRKWAKRYPIDNKEGSGSALLSTGLVSKKIEWILFTFYKCVHGHRAVYFSLYSLMLYNIHYKNPQQLIIFNGLKLHSTGGKRCLEDLNVKKKSVGGLKLCSAF